jgi:hypothetical protein
MNKNQSLATTVTLSGQALADRPTASFQTPHDQLVRQQEGQASHNGETFLAGSNYETAGVQ